MTAVESKSLNLKLGEILRRNHLSITDSRKKILSLFLASPDALAHAVMTLTCHPEE